jgi:secreted trypsin-like serine protease
MEVAEIINHPLFTAKYDYDVALLRLKKDIDFAAPNAPIPICLPEPALYNETYKEKIATVSGWGLSSQDAGATTRILQKLQVPILDMKRCHELMPKTLTNRMICAGFEGGEKDACTGDSGGPLALKNPSTNQWTQIGIVSWGEGCARKGKPGIYSRLTELVQWVYKQAEKASWCRQK